MADAAHSRDGEDETSPGPAFLTGEEVSLHPVGDADVEFLYRWVNDPDVRVDSGIADPVTHADQESWVEGLRESDDETLLVCVDGERAGTVGLKDVDRTDGTADLAYWIAPAFRGNGHATAAVALLIDYAFDERRLHRVAADTYGYNEGSKGVLEKLGFQREGVHREAAFVGGERVDVYRYGLLAEEWRSA